MAVTTDKAEGILVTYATSSSIAEGDPDWPDYQAECDSIWKVLRIIEKHNARVARKRAKKARTS